MERNEEIIPVYVQTLTSKSKRIWINRQARIRSMQWAVMSAFGIPCENQSYILLKNSLQLELDRTFALYNISRDAFIDVVIRLRGNETLDNMYIEQDPKDLITPITIQLAQLNLFVHHMSPNTIKQAWQESINFKPKESDKAYKKLKSLPSDWKKKARKVIPQTLSILGYDQRNIDLVVKALKPVDAAEAVAWLKVNGIIDANPDLVQLFEKFPDVVAEHIVKYLTLAERQSFSKACTTFNRIAKSPAAWKNLVLVSDWSNMTDKCFIKIMKDYGQFIERLSIQRCCYLTPDAVKLIGDFCTNLTVLFAGDCPSMTFAVLDNIFTKCLKLEVVDLRLQSTGNALLVEPVPSVNNLQRLRELNISNRIFAESSEISSQSLQILNIKNSFTESGYSSLKIDCPNLTYLFTSENHKLNDSLKEKLSLKHGISVHIYSGAGDGEYFTSKALTTDKVIKSGIYSTPLQDGTTLWVLSKKSSSSMQ